MKKSRRDSKPLLLSDDPPLLSDGFEENGLSLGEDVSRRASWRKRFFKGFVSGGSGGGGGGNGSSSSGGKHRIRLGDDDGEFYIDEAPLTLLPFDPVTGGSRDDDDGENLNENNGDSGGKSKDASAAAVNGDGDGLDGGADASEGKDKSDPVVMEEDNEDETLAKTAHGKNHMDTSIISDITSTAKPGTKQIEESAPVTPQKTAKSGQRKGLLFGRMRRKKKKQSGDSVSVSSSSQGSQSTGFTCSSTEMQSQPPPMVAQLSSRPPTSILRNSSISSPQKSVSIAGQDGEQDNNNTSTTSSQQVIDDLLRAEAATASPLRSPARRNMSAPQKAIHQYLTRPFGRQHIDTKRCKWAVQVSPAEWDPDERSWKYRINVQQRSSSSASPLPPAAGIPNGNTVRSLADFYWLELALQAEFHGALLLPNLSIALGVPSQQVHDQVDAESLGHWFGDVLNGVRGHGELFLTQRTVHLLASESVEAFLYRGSLTQELIADIGGIALLDPQAQRQAQDKEGNEGEREEGSTGMCFFSLPELCTGGALVVDDPPPTSKSAPPRTVQPLKLPLGMVNCSSRALGGAQSFQVQDSFVEPGTYDFSLSPLTGVAVHTELLAAEQDVAQNWRSRALRVVERQHALAEREKNVGAAWKSFALAISDLFAYEKGMESAKLGDSKSRRDMQMPYRKLQKSAVDDCLRAMAKHKQERYAPALEGMTGLLHAYVADLSAVQPSVDTYLRSAEQLATQKQRAAVEKRHGGADTGGQNGQSSSNSQRAHSSLAEHFKLGLDDLRKQIAGAKPVGGTDDATAENSLLTLEQERKQLRHQLRSTEHRLLAHEALLRDALTTMCKATPVRVARMAYKHYTAEAMHCTMLRSAAVAMRTKISIVNKDSLAKMISRHHIEAKEDYATELKLAQRIVNIGNSKKYSHDDGSSTMSEEVEQGVELDTNSLANVDDGRSQLRDEALRLCNKRIGRWNAGVATAIMKAVGVEVHNIRFEETTRDLRMVQKFAIGLRESLQRCMDALEVLQMSTLQGDGGNGKEDVGTMRRAFVDEMKNLFSATYLPLDGPVKKSAVPSARVLQSAGIHLNDEPGWVQTTEGSCGGAVEKYMKARESNAQWLLDSLSVLLREYNERVEAVESFVFMDCVGIQLEKHFSQLRATALAAFEKKTDITSAMNIATRKRMPMLVHELKAKLDEVGADVSHTTVKESKEAHLESKAAKAELHDLAVRRLTRVREASTERVVAIMALWVKEEESSSNTELQALKDVVNTIISSVGKDQTPYFDDAEPAVPTTTPQS